MSGHNKWSQIKEKKGKTDAKKSQVFSKFAKLIANEARAAKGNKDAPALRAAIEAANPVAASPHPARPAGVAGPPVVRSPADILREARPSLCL